MANYNLYYAVISLTKTQAEGVIRKLREEGRNSLADWLDENKDIIYGDIPEDWKPFKDEKIKDIIDKNSTYKSETALIYELDEDCKNADNLSCVHIFFIDIFAMYIEKYKQLAIRLDYAFRDAKESSCCFLMSYALPIAVQEELEKKYKKTWPFVSKGYVKGFRHRIAVRVDDVKNFKNFIKDYIVNRDSPNSANRDKVEKLGPSKDVPRLGGQ